VAGETTFGTWIRQRRKSLDFTQQALADRVGCSVSAIRKIESDERKPSRQIAQLLAQCLELPPEAQAAFVKASRSGYLYEAPFIASHPSARLPQPIMDVVLDRLPRADSPLVGRSFELAQVVQTLKMPHCRLLTLVGLPGIGKTRLALEAAHLLAEDPAGEFYHSAYFIPLSAVSNPGQVIPAIAASLGLQPHPGVPVSVQLHHHLRDTPMLLVLDNYEQLVESALELAELLQHAAQLKLLLTSRERVNIRGEWLVDIHSLPFPEIDDPCVEEGCFSSVELFVQCARRVDPHFIYDDHSRPWVARICRLVSGMPLGIELAAAWARLLSCREIAQEIERNLDFLATGLRDVPARHRSIRAAFDYSWQLLSADEQRAFCRLACLTGVFSRQQAEALPEISLPVLQALADKSLLYRAGENRFAMHNLVRQYAAARSSEGMPGGSPCGEGAPQG